MPTSSSSPSRSPWTLLIWASVVLIALLWTAGAWALGSALDWIGHAISSGEVGEWRQAVDGWTPPTWWAHGAELLGWGALADWRDGLVWVLEGVSQALPWAGQAMSWLIPLTWMVWGLGMLMLLLLGGLLHLWVRWMIRSQAAA